jgi:fructose-1,6-bisphosphatase I
LDRKKWGEDRLKEILNAIEKSAILIADAIDRDSFSYAESHNAHGDHQLELDLQCDKIIEDEFKTLQNLKGLSSEEKEGFLEIGNGEILISYDPLDGSSLVDVNLSVGSIFGIYKDDFLGKNMIASAYVVYGPRVEIVFADEVGVKLYRLNKAEKKFHFVKDLKLGEKGKITATGAVQKGWNSLHKSFVEQIFSEGYRLRYSGGMVPDLHQILLKGGGIFSYPSTSDKPKAKLRMLFEVFPFAFIFEKAGGFALDESTNRVLEVIPENLHDTSPCFFASKYEIEVMKKYYGNK